MTDNQTQVEAPTTEKHFVTEWATVHVRMHREGNLYQLEVLTPRHDERGHFITLQEQVALAMEDVWT